MPTYSYRCSACGHQFEAMQRFSDDPLTDCPSCGGRVRRVIHPVGVVFKGSGWYITDSRKPAAGETKADDRTKPDKTKDDAKKPAAATADSAPTTAKPEAAKPVAAD